MTNMKYFLYCDQREGYYPAGEKETFDNLKAIASVLIHYHDIDYTGVDSNDVPYKSLNHFIDTLQNPSVALQWLLDYGEWSIHDVEGEEIDFNNYDENLKFIKLK